MDKINQPDVVAPFGPGLLIGDVDPFGEQAVKGFVVGNEVGGGEAAQLAQGIGAGGGRDGGVEAFNGGCHPAR